MKTKKILAVLLSVLMALSMFGVAALANDEPGYNSVPTSTSYLEPGDTWFNAEGYADATDIYSYSYASYYLSEDGETLKVTVNEETEYFTRADHPEVFEYLLVLAEFGDPLPFSEEGLEDLAYWFDLNGYCAYMQQYYEVIFSIEFSAEYSEEEIRAEIASEIESFRTAEYRLSTDGIVLRATIIVPSEEDPENPYIYNRDATKDDPRMMWGFLRQKGVDPNEGFTEIPTADSEALADGAYWFDYNGVLAVEGVFLGYPEEAGIYSLMKMYLSNDFNTLKISMMGDESSITRDGSQQNAFYFKFLHQHGEAAEDLTGYAPVVLDKTLVKEGDWYFDVDSIAAEFTEDEERQATVIEMLRTYYAFYYDSANDALKGKFSATFIDEVEDRTEILATFRPYLAKVQLVNAVAATCTEDGYTGDLAITVNEENVILAEGEAIPAGHVFDATIAENVTEVAATCTAKGSVTVKCANCDETQVTEIAAKGHTWGDWTVTKAATATEKGVETRECTVCHEKENRDIAPTGDNGGNNGGSNDSGANKCKYCGEEHTGFWGKIVGFFHNIMYFFAHLFGRK